MEKRPKVNPGDKDLILLAYSTSMHYKNGMEIRRFYGKNSLG